MACCLLSAHPIAVLLLSATQVNAKARSCKEPRCPGVEPTSCLADSGVHCLAQGVTPPISRISSLQDARTLELQGKGSGEARELSNHGRPPLRPPPSAASAPRNGLPLKGDEQV